MISIGFCVAAGDAFGQEPEVEHPTGEIVVNQSGDQTYHHITLDLTNADLSMAAGLMSRDLAYSIADGGQFEIFVQPGVLPIEAPGCQDGIIVRMPWTNPDLPDADDAMADKTALLAQFDALRDGQVEEVRSTLELDPYLTLDEAGRPHALSQCNVFFRHASGRYVDHNHALTAD